MGNIKRFNFIVCIKSYLCAYDKHTILSSNFLYCLSSLGCWVSWSLSLEPTVHVWKVQDNQVGCILTSGGFVVMRWHMKDARWSSIKFSGHISGIWLMVEHAVASTNWANTPTVVGSADNGLIFHDPQASLYIRANFLKHLNLAGLLTRLFSLDKKTFIFTLHLR